MLKQLYILLLAAILALPLLMKAQDTVVSDSVDVSRSRDIETSDVVSDDSVPIWYVEPVIPEELRSPMRTAASACLTDSILTFNIDSVLTEATTYDYDAAGRTIRTTVWQYNADGSRTGKSKQEYAFDASGTQIYTGSFAWDATTNDWKGTAKSEYVYNEAHKMESNITYIWVNNTWLPSQALTYAYDAAGRETEFTTYTRNASVNHLVPSKQRLQTWYNASKKTLEINYTAYSNGAWSAGNKKEYDYDAKGNQIEYTYYASYSGGNWVGSTHELWTYNAANKKTYYEKQTWTNGTWANSSKEIWQYNADGKQTLYENYSGSGSNWIITLQENSGYDVSNRNVLIENYSYTNGVEKGSKKEMYAYFNATTNKTSIVTFSWANGAWVRNDSTVNDYDAANNVIENCKYKWQIDTWIGSGSRTLKVFNGANKVTNQVKQTWSATINSWQNKDSVATTYSGSNKTEEKSFKWQNDSWIGTAYTYIHYNAAGLNDTTMTYKPIGDGWRDSLRTVTTYSGNTAILTHNAKWDVPSSTWKMVSMTRTDIIMNGLYQLLKATWHCGSDSVWIGDQKDTTFYSATDKPIFTARYTSWANNDWVPSYKVNYVYDEADRTTITERFNWSNNQWKGYYRYEYEYDELGRTISSAYYNAWNTSLSTWVGSSKLTTVYNEAGKTSSLINYEWRNNVWSPKSNTLFEYDDAGNIVEQIVQNYTDNAWVNSIRYEKAYKGSTLVVSNDYTWLNNAWQITRRSEKTYDEDASAKLRREIAGSWNNSGVMQSFTDNYYFYSCDAPTVNNGSQPRTPTELEEIDENNAQPFDPTQPAYNLSGQRVEQGSYHGVVVQNGRKYHLW